MRAAPNRGSIPLRLHGDVVPDCLENGSQHASRRSRLAAKTIEHELRDRCIPHQLGSTQHLEVTGDGRLGQIEDGLQIRHEERCRGQAVQDPQPGRLGDREQEVGGRGDGRCCHIRVDEYKKEW